MTVKMVHIDDDYAEKFEEFINASNGHIEVIKDPNLEYDPYFYERKASLDATIKAVEDVTMKVYDEDEFELEMDKIEQELIEKYDH